SVGAHHADHVADSVILQGLARRLHLRLVVGRAHDDADQRGVHLDLLERLLHARHRRQRDLPAPGAGLALGELHLLRSSSNIRRYAAAACSAARAAISLRICIPSNEMRCAASYARCRAACAVGPSPVTLSTLPPAVTIASPRLAVPACSTSTPSRRSASSMPEMTSPDEELAG